MLDQGCALQISAKDINKLFGMPFVGNQVRTEREGHTQFEGCRDNSDERDKRVVFPD